MNKNDKKFITIGLVVIAVLFVVNLAIIAIGINILNTRKTTSKEAEPKATVAREKTQVKQNEDEPPINVGDITPSCAILPRDSIGTVYANITYENNTDKTIVGVEYEVLLKDTNEKVYYVSYDTVLPGETSPIFEGFGPQSGKLEDIEILKLCVSIGNDDGTTTYVEVDDKLGQCEWWTTEY